MYNTRAMQHQNLFVFDIETVPDTDAIPNLTGFDDPDVARSLRMNCGRNADGSEGTTTPVGSFDDASPYLLTLPGLSEAQSSTKNLKTPVAAKTRAAGSSWRRSWPLPFSTHPPSVFRSHPTSS